MTDQPILNRILDELLAIRTELAEKPSRGEMREAIADARAEAKADNRALREELYAFRAEIKGEVGELRGELGDLREELHAFRAEINGKVDVLREHFDAFTEYADQTYVKKAPAR
ncbi:hypothetical protein D3874_18310 [Oleomonas cavernae]|uniref:Uncharacterized protein n=2 Tax=Oleomonas cavernae TaxID=2320859 RepID=A0A418WFE1_9PROT|nr:hypothetical protein D3874_18310 [Oleomonas cavernae]